ncbi:unnamed protein product [Rhodiola kirilowii]
MADEAKTMRRVNAASARSHTRRTTRTSSPRFPSG